MLPHIEIKRMREFVCYLTKDAGKVALKYFRGNHLKHSFKGKNDIVTSADLEIDAFFRKNLMEKFPSIPLLTEETFKGNFAKYEHNNYLWVIDPIDGTHNFSRGDTRFAISIALVSHKKTVIGICNLPALNEFYWTDTTSSRVFMNDNPLPHSLPTSNTRYIISIDAAYETLPIGQFLYSVEKLYPHLLFIKVSGSAVCDILSLVNQRLDVLFYQGFKPWDVASAAEIVIKSGVKVTDQSGKPFDLYGQSMLAAHPKLHKRILTLLTS